MNVGQFANDIYSGRVYGEIHAWVAPSLSWISVQEIKRVKNGLGWRN